MLTISKEANPNYLCKVVQLKGVKKHTNAHSLQTVDINFQTVITGMDAKDGDIYVFFPVESKINDDFLSKTNSFRDKSKNVDPDKAGFFEDKCRVKAMKLRGEKSMGYIVPIQSVAFWAYGADAVNLSTADYLSNQIGTDFDTINGKKLVEKYVVKKKEPRDKQGKKPKVSRLIEGQVHLHIDTENLRRNADKIRPTDLISITYKTHGTSWWVSNVMVKKKLNWRERVAKWLGFNVTETEYDLIYGSRRVVKNSSLDDPKQKDHFYGYDLWEDIKNEIGEHIPKGYTLYGEMLGYDKNGKMIQKDYDYGCAVGEHKLEVYRITHTTPDGLVTELSYPQIKDFCDKTGLTPSRLFFYGEAGTWLTQQGVYVKVDWYNEEEFSDKFVTTLEDVYNEKDCQMCVNKVPEEGIVVRKEKLFSCESYKLKSFRFLEKESKQLDTGEVDVESEN